MNDHVYQVIRRLPNLEILVGEYESIHRAKFIMNKAAKYKSTGRYSITKKENSAYLKAEQLAIDIALNK